jgi:phospholipase/lecithinase/hemolysin
MKKIFVGRAVMFALSFVLSAPVLAAAEPFSRIVVFGTSLSDPGNDFAMRGIENVPPYNMLDPFLLPDAPYSKGGHHVSNGATWAEHLGRYLGLSGSVGPALRGRNLNATNYAVKGARACEDGINFNLSAQISKFLTDFNDIAPSDALYAIEIGANDLRDAFELHSEGGYGGATMLTALNNIAGSIQALYSAGARNFIVWKMPNIGLTPAFLMIDRFSPGASAVMTNITKSYNAGLESVLFMLEGLPGIHIKRFDAYQILNKIVSNPGIYSISVVDKACVTPNVAPYECKNPEEYLFWDGIHPTTAVHAIFGKEAALLLEHQ